MNWLVKMCYTNMVRRKNRTILTILGVAIGVVSVTAMISLGLGVKKTLIGDMDSETIRQITVTGLSSGKNTRHMVTDKTIEDFEEIDNVESVYPTYSIETTVTYNNYSAMFTSITGIPEEQLETKDYKNGEVQTKGIKPELVLGSGMASQFYNDSMTSTLKDNGTSTSDLFGKRVTLVSGYGDSESKDTVKVCGVLKKNEDSVTLDNESIYCNIDILIKYAKRLAGSGVPQGQPTDDDGNAVTNDWVYSSAIVVVDDIDNVKAVSKALKDMGFQTEDNKSYLDYMNKNLKTVQILLVGIGLIALVVAVIGVSNTMITAVYDRIKEIGILKVLGCDPEELMLMFLMEAGAIGGLGGAFGIGITYAIKGIINKAAIRYMSLPKSSEIAIMPWWLVISVFAGSIVLGVLAGYVPSKFAVKMRPIESMKN